MRFLVGPKLAISLTIAASTACAAGAERESLTLWHAWGGAELATLKLLIREFQARPGGVEVMALQIPHDRLLDKYTRSSASNGGPDLLIGDNDWSGKLAEADLVAPIFDFAATGSAGLFPASAAARFPAPVVGALRVGDKTYAWPESVETVVLYHNRKLLGRPPGTVPEMLAAAASLAIPGGYGLVYNTGFYFFSGYFLGGGGSVFDPGGRPRLDSAEGRRMLAWLRELSRAPGVLATNDYGKADSLYKQGKTAMIVNGPWALADYQAALGPDLGVAALPRLGGGQPAAPWIGVKCLMVNANASPSQRRRAASFLEFVSEPAQQLALATGAGHIPAIVDLALPADSPLRVFQAQVESGTPKSANPRLALIWGPMDRAIQEVTVHGHDAGDSLARAQQTLAAQLEAVEANR